MRLHMIMHATAQVVIKRIGDVLSSSENAKRVLREVALLRRLRHPHIIRLRDAFTQPSDTGKIQTQQIVAR